MNFKSTYENLNIAQKQAVDQIDGPVLVIAGPGTGKTQLLSARVANILEKTDTLAQNVLCLTFTESGAANMRERLTGFIGQSAYDVGISTYHAFGGDLIRRFPEYFGETRLQEPVDQLGKREIVAEIVEQMSYLNPLKQTRHHLGDLMSTISEVKRSLLTGHDLEAIALENTVFITKMSSDTSKLLEDFVRMPRTVEKASGYFESILKSIETHQPKSTTNTTFGTLAAVAKQQLEAALETAGTTNKTSSLTKWKNDWLAKDANNNFVFSGELENKRMAALAEVCEKYQQALEKRGLYDFDDMIIRSIDALQQNADLKYTLQEQYQYLLLDEFQDTNAAQLRLVELLTDNPVNERRPNVLAVGDDDQAIYAFQGAQYSNMLDFYNLFDGVLMVNLTQNYRSHDNILKTAHNVAGQIEARLHHNFESMSKTLIAANKKLTSSTVERHEFISEIGEYDWIASQIETLVKGGVSASEIAVLAPRHKYLEPLVPYLNSREIAVHYEKRENILETPVVLQLLTMSRLVIALKERNEQLEASLWPEVLSYPFWQLPTSTIWRLSWKVSDNHKNTTWTQSLLEDPTCKQPALLFLALANQADSTTLEDMLDYLVGTKAVETMEPDSPTVTSPLRQFYASAQVQKPNPELFYETLSHLTVLRQKLRDHQASKSELLKIADLIHFVELYELADERMINTSPYNQSADAVQLMTVFKAKGLEFKYVFLPRCHDDVWGDSSRGNSNKITLPANLSPMRHAGTNQDERLRLFFVAITRAKIGLYLTSFSQSYSGKQTKRLKYLDEQLQPDGSFKTLVLPEALQNITLGQEDAPAIEALETSWRTTHLQGIATTQLKDLLHARIKNYQLSPTHLNAFTDLQYAGPEAFFFNTILRFPQGPTADGQFGNAIHETLEWLQYQLNEHQTLPHENTLLQYFDKQLLAKRLTKTETTLLSERGERALKSYLQARGQYFSVNNVAEHGFRNEGVLVDGVHLGGKIDRMEVNKAEKTIVVVDYKTGKSYEKWASDLKLHKYKQQLYCYKLLIEGSHTYKGYTVTSGRLDFIEPDVNGKINSLELEFKEADLKRTRLLLTALWQRIQALDFPDISEFDQTLAGVKKFEDWLIENLT